jgi:hypothetical protein
MVNFCASARRVGRDYPVIDGNKIYVRDGTTLSLLVVE